MSITTLAFSDGDFVVRQGGLVEITDNEAILQTIDLGLRLQVGFNQYFPAAGWDWMRWLGAPIDQGDAEQICSEVKALCEAQSDVRSADVTYLGLVDEQQAFSIEISTAYGSEQLAYILGGALVHRGS